MALGTTPHKNYSYAYNNSVGQHYVTMLSNYIGPYPLEKVDRHSRKDQRKVQVSRPSLIKTYNNAMGGVNLVDAAVGTYGSQIKGKKWWWPHLTVTLGVLVGAAWNIYCVTNPDEDQSLLFFISVVQSYLHLDAITRGPSFWKTKIQLLAATD